MADSRWAGVAPRAAVSIALLASVAACSSATSGPKPAGTPGAVAGRATLAPWDRPADQDVQVQAAGLTLTATEQVAVHYHAHLDVIVRGTAIPVPAELGINVGPDNTAPPHGSPGIAALHTHDVTGILHIEAPATAVFTLGQLFTEWNVALSRGQVGAYRIGDSSGDRVRVFVNGVPTTTDPAAIALTAHEEIAVVVDSAAQPATGIPSSYAFPPGD
jgi:hypothetical protein